MIPSAVGVYIFAGGFTVGLQEHFDVLCHLESSNFGVETVRKNIGVQVYTEPMAWPLDELKEDGVDMVFANPPCAPFSAAGRVSHETLARRGITAKHQGDPRVSCIHKTFDVVEKLQPRIFIFESVSTMWTEGKTFVTELCMRAAQSGFSVTIVLHNTVDCGVPQFRRRLFFVGHKNQFRPTKPTMPRKTLREALEGIEPGTAIPTHKSVLAIYHETPPGTPFYRTFDRLNPNKESTGGKVLGRPGYVYKKTHWDRPSGTCTGASLFHPDEPRAFSMEELNVICGFPSGYEFQGALSSRYSQIARGVMPPVARWIAPALKEACYSEPILRPQMNVVDFMGQSTYDENQMELEV